VPIRRAGGPAAGSDDPTRRGDAPARRVSGQAIAARTDGRFRAWIFPLAISLALAFLIEGTYVLAERNVDGVGIFVGQSWAPHDVAQYVAAIDDGRAGALLIHDRLTSEPHRPAFIYGFYVLLGWLARPFGDASGATGHSAVALDSITVYRIAGVVGRVFVLLALYGATSLVSPARSRRRLAFGLCAVGGGIITLLGLATAVLLPFVGPIELPVSGRDLEETELGTFLLLFASPHLMFGLGLLVLTGLAYARAWRSRGWGMTLTAAGLTFALGVVNSYSLGTLCAVVSAHAVVMTVLARRLIWRGLAAAALVNLAALPILAYGVLTFVLGADPFWGIAYGRQNVTPTPSVLNVMVSFGLVLVLAVAGTPAMARRLTPGRVLVLTWIIVAALLMYLPVGVQRRFAFGLQPMLAMVAAFGLPPLWRVVSARRRLPWTFVRPLGIVLLIQALGGSAILLSAVAFSRAGEAADFRPGEERSDFFPAALAPAGRWLGQHATADDVVLADATTSNYLVQTMPGRVYVGHWSATVEYLRKRDEVAWLFGGDIDDDRRAFLHNQDVRYVVIGPTERRHLAWTAPSLQTSGLTPAYDADGVTIYEVTQ
jgi:hypothetical protein